MVPEGGGSSRRIAHNNVGPLLTLATLSVSHRLSYFRTHGRHARPITTLLDHTLTCSCVGNQRTGGLEDGSTVRPNVPKPPVPVPVSSVDNSSDREDGAKSSSHRSTERRTSPTRNRVPDGGGSGLRLSHTHEGPLLNTHTRNSLRLSPCLLMKPSQDRRLSRRTRRPSGLPDTHSPSSK